MKAASEFSIKHIAVTLLAVISVPFLLIGIMVWSIVTFGKMGALAIVKARRRRFS